ncbi:hypothetical protein A8B77_11600 [Erythrobacter sp. EhN03]|uniref:hypothetical protein n=1 Tax=Qipengyuania flava TaxID=192812 RepID=UPI0007F42B6D|nr:hypothetical protein A8B77_11600 [Erythrobacter sp. EhN03]
MAFSLLFLAVAGSPAADAGSMPKYSQFCVLKSDERIDDSATLKAKCLAAAKALRKVELELIAQENKAHKLDFECRELLDRMRPVNRMDQFDKALAELKNATTGGSDTKATTQCELANSADGTSEQRSSLKTLIKKRDAAFAAVRKGRDDLKTGMGELRKLHGTDSKFVAAPAVQVYTPPTNQTDEVYSFEKALANVGSDRTVRPSPLDACRIDPAATRSRIVVNANECTKLAIAIGDPLVRHEGGKQAGSPVRKDLLPKIAIEATGGKGGITISDTFKRFRSARVTDWHVRQPNAMTYEVGVEVGVDEGVGSIFSDATDRGDFFTDRLSSTIALKGSLGWNFYPKQKRPDFDKELEKLYRDFAAKCRATLVAATTWVPTDCAERNLLAWVYERKDGRFVRKDQVDKYEKLIWQSGAVYPEFGGGFTVRFGLPQVDYFEFSDSDGEFDPTLVDTADFFENTDGPTLGKARRGPLPAFEIGGYGFRHWSLAENGGFLEGVTFRGDVALRRDFPDLSKKKIEICRIDLPSPAIADVINESERCKDGILTFRPALETSAIVTGQLRLMTRKYDGFGAIGIAPSIQGKFGDDDIVTIEVPLYYSQSGEGLKSGVKFVHRITYGDQKDESASALLFFFSTDFSLDGSN